MEIRKLIATHSTRQMTRLGLRGLQQMTALTPTALSALSDRLDDLFHNVDTM